jgi:hypothetical protein
LKVPPRHFKKTALRTALPRYKEHEAKPLAHSEKQDIQHRRSEDAGHSAIQKNVAKELKQN